MRSVHAPSVCSFLTVFFRDFIELDLVNFATDNPGVVVYLKPRRHKTAIMKAEYCMY